MKLIHFALGPRAHKTFPLRKQPFLKTVIVMELRDAR